MTDVHLVFKKLIERMCYKPLNGHIVHILLLLILLQTSVQLDQCTETVRLSLGQFPGGSDGKGSACNAGDPGLIPESGKSPGEGNGNPLEYPGLENSVDRGAWQATVHEVAKSQT